MTWEYGPSDGRRVVLDVAATLFPSPTDDKNEADARQVAVLKATVVAKEAWVRVSEVKRERALVEDAIRRLEEASVAPACPYEVSSQLLQRLASEKRLKDGQVDEALHEAQLREVQLQQVKLRNHEAQIRGLQDKIGAVERMKKAQASSPLGVTNPDDPKPKRFFCDTFQGLSRWYCKCLLERGWLPYPAEEWFVTEKTALKVFSPLARATVDYCHTASFTRAHSIFWEGGEWLEDKDKLAELLKDTRGIMPPQFTVDAEGNWSDLLCLCSRSTDDGGTDDHGQHAHGPTTATTEGFLDRITAWTAESGAEGLAEQRWFVKDATRNFGLGNTLCASLSHSRQAVRTGERFVVQLGVAPQQLLAGHVFSIRVYLLVVATHSTQPADLRFFTADQGWIASAAKAFDPGLLDAQSNMSRERSIRLREWGPWQPAYRACRESIKQVLLLARDRFVIKGLPTFELFGVDFVMDAAGKPWLLEINRSPRQMQSDCPMMHAQLDLALQEEESPPEFHTPWKWELLPLL